MWSSSRVVSEEEQTESSSFSTSLFNFSSGNPRIEETRGLMHVFPEQTPPSLPVGRKPLACVLGVPNHMTYADFCQFCGSFIQHILEMRIVRMESMEDRYSVLIRFDEQDSTDAFYTHYNERLDQDTSGILTTICNHSFHCSCISKWADSSCPVCRYCQQQAENSICFVCQTTENLWICVICGFVGCGRYKGGHAIIHWKETQHCYSLEVETKRVWDYVGDNYVHRLIQSKTDGKLVELNSHCVHADSGSCGDNAMREAILNSKVQAIVNEYNELLATQLENQKLYFESLLQQVEQETEGKISVAVQKAVSLKQHKIHAKIDRCNKEKKFLDELNDNLLKNEEIWKAKLLEIEEREKKALKLTTDRVTDLEKQLSNLMVCLEGGKTEEHPPLSNANDGTVSVISKVSSVKL
ncbi:zinc finger, C3HC4 type (RING finger) protein [Medicago truncatula]|uniref:Zinc finger, C3HC4 type (RING finger) protein n=1 Tax=Medicago truncatula TaxID=3880 RepID=G7IMB8_MEDTR|nr:zinc finger, C3HC4 type (RING finger) protein [Medicago truncatula]